MEIERERGRERESYAESEAQKVTGLARKTRIILFIRPHCILKESQQYYFQILHK